MITADTITDSQVLALLDEALAHAYPGSAAHWREQYEAADTALYSIYSASVRDLPACPKRRARARCAEILNARGGK